MTARKRYSSVEDVLEDSPKRSGDIYDLVTTAMGIEYLFEMPESVPEDRILVHNHVRRQPRLGQNGFRAWLHGPEPDLDRHEVCDCGWAPQFAEHYRVIR